MSVNRVLLLGNVGADPEIRDGQGGKFATMRVATTKKGYVRRDGQQVPERTEWHSLVASGGIVQVIEGYVRKGSKVYVEGELRTRRYTDRNNVERTVTEIFVNELELCGGKPEQQQPQPSYGSQPFQQAQPPVAGTAVTDYMPY